jgi:hypothetical protein
MKVFSNQIEQNSAKFRQRANMKTTGKRCWLLVSLLSLAVVAGCTDTPEAEKTKADAKAMVEKSADTARDVVAQGKVVATNVVAEVRQGWQKAGAAATNVAAKVRTTATNVAGEIKEKVGSATN